MAKAKQDKATILDNERPEERFATFVEMRAREIAREEIASLGGLMLRRIQEHGPGAVDASEFAAVWGEVLRDFGATEHEPGPARSAEAVLEAAGEHGGETVAHDDTGEAA